MDFIKAVDIIKKDLDEAGALLEQLAAAPGAHVAEIELARSRVHSAKEMLKLLPLLNAAPQADAAEKAPAPAAEKKVVEKAEKIEKTEETVKESMTASEKPAEVKEQVNETAGQAPAVQKQQQEAAKAILADRLGSTAGTIAEKISTEKHEEVITTVLHSKPIKDIASAIGINDRFYYIRELFSGDSLAYQDAIRRLDAASSLGEAMKILDESTVMGSDPAAQSSFVDVVRRKFSINV
jgi:outer membrane biosynthesis protein TonB